MQDSYNKKLREVVTEMVDGLPVKRFRKPKEGEVVVGFVNSSDCFSAPTETEKARVEE